MSIAASIDVFPHDPSRPPWEVVCDGERPLLTWDDYRRGWELFIPNDGNPDDYIFVCDRDDVPRALREAEEYYDKWIMSWMTGKRD